MGVGAWAHGGSALARSFVFALVHKNQELTQEINTPINEEPEELIIESVNISDYNGFSVSCNGESDGFIEVTNEPGWGIEINSNWLENSQYEVCEAS